MRVKIYHRITLSLITLLLTCSGFAGNVEKVRPFHYLPRLSLGSFYQTNVTAFGLFDFFAPFTINPDTIVFLDPRAIVNNGSTYEINIGAGYRHILSSQKWMVGAYLFYDRRQSQFHNGFDQMTLGGEFKSKIWSFLVNGYIPVGDSAQFTTALDQTGLVPDGIYKNIFYVRGVEKSLGGADAMVGLDIPYTNGLRIYVGGFYFARKDVPTAVGPVIQAQYNLHREHYKPMLWIFNRINFIANFEHSKNYGNNWFAGVRFDILFAKKLDLHGLQNRMRDFVRRDLDVRTSGNSNAPRKILLQPNGQPVRVRQVGTLANFNLARADANTNIIAVEGAFAVAVDSTILNNQIMSGGAHPFVAEGHPYSVQVGNNGSLSAGGTVIRIGTNNTIENISITPTIALPAIRNVGDTNGVGSFTIFGVTSNQTLVGITINDGSTTSSIGAFNNVASSATAPAFSIAATNGTLAATIFNNNFSNTVAQGVLVVDADGAGGILNISGISSNTLTTTAGSGLTVQARNGGVVNTTGAISNNFITSSASPGAVVFTVNDGTASSLNMNGGFTNNTVRCIQAGCNAVGVTTTNSSGNNSVLTIQGFNGNSITGVLSGININEVATTTITINVLSGGNGLSAANGNTSVVNVGGTVNPSV